jgi:hypothetical protein
VSENLRLGMRRWTLPEVASKSQRRHLGRLTGLVVTSKIPRVERTDHSWKKRATILSRNPFVDGGGSEWAQAARACQILTLVVRVQVGRKSLCMCNLWRQNNWRKQRIIRIERNEGPKRESWKQKTYQLLHGA